MSSGGACDIRNGDAVPHTVLTVQFSFPSSGKLMSMCIRFCCTINVNNESSIQQQHYIRNMTTKQEGYPNRGLFAVFQYTYKDRQQTSHDIRSVFSLSQSLTSIELPNLMKLLPPLNRKEMINKSGDLHGISYSTWICRVVTGVPWAGSP